MIKRESLTAEKEITPRTAIVMTAKKFGRWLTGMLLYNTSSWLHYNLAAHYWQVRGNAPQAMECSRLAVYYAPREYQDIALLNLGTILHRSKMTKDAIIVLNAAVNHYPKFCTTHVVLGNAYAVAGDYNRSLYHFDECLKLIPEHDTALKYKRAVLCHRSLSQNMTIIQDLLDKLYTELTEYTNRYEYWIKSQAAFLKAMNHNREYDIRNIDNNCEKISEITGLDIKAVYKAGKQIAYTFYQLNRSKKKKRLLLPRGVHALETASNIHNLVQHIENAEISSQEREDNGKDYSIILKEIGPMSTVADLDIGKVTSINKKPAKSSTEDRQHFPEFEGGALLYPPSLKVNRNIHPFDRDPDWPTFQQCEEVVLRAAADMVVVYPVFMPFENKGIWLNDLLSNKIGVPVTEEHELPWRPPLCPSNKLTAAYSQKKMPKRLNGETVPIKYLRKKLVEYVHGSGETGLSSEQDAEIGQRILTAMQKKVGPAWLLQTLASLYWRVRGHNINALQCLLNARQVVPVKYRDIVFTSLGSVLLEMGYNDHAATLVEETFVTSVYEPSTNFLLAQLSMMRKDRTAQLVHLKQTLRVEPEYLEGLPWQLLLGWACLPQRFLQQLEAVSAGMCTEVMPGLSLVCDADGSDCRIGDQQCPSSSESLSKLIQMLDRKSDELFRASIEDFEFNLSVFEKSDGEDDDTE